MNTNDNLSVFGTSIVVLIITIAIILLWDKARNTDLNIIESPEETVIENPAS